MSEIDNDLQRRLKAFAEEVTPQPGRGAEVIRLARIRRRVAAIGAGLMAIVLLGGVAGAASVLRGRNRIDPAPRPETLTEADLASMTVDELAAALFTDDELEEAVPMEVGFSPRQIVRHGPDDTNHAYATVGVQMEGPVDYARAIFFVHPTEAAARKMAENTTARANHRTFALNDVSSNPFPVSNGLPGATCAATEQQLLSCHAHVGRVMLLTESSAGRRGSDMSDQERDAAIELISSFGSYLEHIYPEPDAATSARYFFEVDEGGASASGTLEVDAQQPSLCLEVQTRDITASHLVFDDPSRPEGTGRWSVAFTFFDPDDGEGGPELPPTGTHCFAKEQLETLEKDGFLEDLVENPDRFRVDFHRGPNDERALVAELQPEPRVTTERCDVPMVRPTYLPWLANDEAIPPPLHTYDSDIDMPGRVWSDPDNPDVSVTITRRPEQLQSGPGERTGIRMEGAEGELSFHHGNSVAIAWNLVNERCNLVVLSFDYGERSVGVAKNEVMKVARSLRRDSGAPPADEAAIRQFVGDFLQARVERAGAEDFLGTEGWPEAGPTGEPEPLYPHPPLNAYRIEFVSRNLGGGSYEVGVSLLFEDGTTAETLFVRERDSGFVISGVRPGLEGP